MKKKLLPLTCCGILLFSIISCASVPDDSIDGSDTLTDTDDVSAGDVLQSEKPDSVPSWYEDEGHTEEGNMLGSDTTVGYPDGDENSGEFPETVENTEDNGSGSILEPSVGTPEISETDMSEPPVQEDISDRISQELPVDGTSPVVGEEEVITGQEAVPDVLIPSAQSIDSTENQVVPEQSTNTDIPVSPDSAGVSTEENTLPDSDVPSESGTGTDNPAADIPDNAVTEPDLISGTEPLPETVETQPDDIPAKENSVSSVEYIPEDSTGAAADTEKPETEQLTGIAENQDESGAEPELSESISVLESEKPAEPVVPSRSVVMDNRQYLDIVYPGSGWVYLGEVTPDGYTVQKPLLTYFGRRRNNNDTSFTLRSGTPGTTILHFFKQDVLTAVFIDDYLEVTVTDTVAESGSRQIAPSYADIIPQYQDIIPLPENFSIMEEADNHSGADAVAAAGSAAEKSGSAYSDSDVAEPADSSAYAAPVIENPDSIAGSGITIAPVSEPVSGSTVASVPETVSEKELNESVAVSSAGTNAFSRNQDQISGQDAENPSRGSSGVSDSIDQSGINAMVPDGAGTSGMAADTANTAGAAETSDIPVGEDISVPEEVNLLALAQEAYYNEDYTQAADYVNSFLSSSKTNLDAGLYLKGQIYEAASDIRNIRMALDAYQQVISGYPLSPFWQQAKNREIYLSRFYFDIR